MQGKNQKPFNLVGINWDTTYEYGYTFITFHGIESCIGRFKEIEGYAQLIHTILQETNTGTSIEWDDVSINEKQLFDVKLSYLVPKKFIDKYYILNALRAWLSTYQFYTPYVDIQIDYGDKSGNIYKSTMFNRSVLRSLDYSVDIDQCVSFDLNFRAYGKEDFYPNGSDNDDKIQLVWGD